MNERAARLRRGVSVLLIAGGCAGLAMLARMIVHGHIAASPTRWFFPQVALAGTVLLFAAAASFRRCAAGSLKSLLLPFTGRVLLLALSLMIAGFGGELVVRSLLERQSRRNDLDVLQRAGQGENIKATGSHPLVHIIRVSPFTNLVFELKTNLAIDFGHKRLRTNAAGMRESREYALAHPANCVRIIGIGDSGMFGWDQHQGFDYLSVLESNLQTRSRGVTYEVLNMAVPGYNTAQEVELLAQRGLAYRPDIVVLGWNVNDFGIPFCVPQRANFKRRDVSFLWLLLFDRTRLGDIVNSKVRDLRDFNRKDLDPWVVRESGVDGVFRNLKRLKAMSASNRFHVLAVGPMKKQERDLFKRVGIEALNTYRDIPATNYPKEYLISAMHPRTGGHRVIAEHLERELDRRGWLRPAGRPADGG